MNEDKIEISKEEYNHLCRLEQFVSNYYGSYRVCKKCGAYVADGYICFECSHDPSYEWKKLKINLHNWKSFLTFAIDKKPHS